jgi:thiol-disulfide isomerase/thioredoxin
MKRIALPLLISALLTACAQQTPAPSATSAAAPATASASGADRAPASGEEIAWRKGDVDAAFKEAVVTNKPVLLYWGAVWCPPCHQLKAYVFNRADFIAKTRLFVPVYLDGDDAGAQRWGEEFKVTGYPTMVVLTPQRAELARINSGMDLTQYANVLDNALSDMQPVETVLAAAGRRQLKDNECRRLAYNGWVLDETSTAVDVARIAQLQQAARACPPKLGVERIRLALFSIYFAEKANKPVPQTLVEPVNALLADNASAADQLDVLRMLGDQFMKAVGAPGSPAALAFNARFARAMDLATTHPRYTLSDHLVAVGNKLAVAKALTGKIDPALAASARKILDDTLATKTSNYERLTIINAALGVFDILGANADAYTYLQGELSKSDTPYYYQADLADLAEELGKKDEALAWSAKAYEGSRGAATRFQWGKLYLSALLRLKPEDSTQIRATGIQVLGELDGTDRIYRRARQRLAALDGELQKWAKADAAQRQPVLRDLRAHLNTTCAKIPAGEPARVSCEAFLRGAG